jgi:hypothetical protein
MKYYTSSGKVATIYGDIEAARRCFEAASKGSAAVNNKLSRKDKSSTSKSTADRPMLPHRHQLCRPGFPLLQKGTQRGENAEERQQGI